MAFKNVAEGAFLEIAHKIFRRLDEEIQVYEVTGEVFLVEEPSQVVAAKLV